MTERFEIVSALKDDTYRAVAVGNAVSMLGIWMQKVAVGWLAWELSQSTAWLGAVAAADLLPAVVLSSFTGSLADGRNKSRLVMAAQLAAMIQALVLGGLTLAGLIDIWMLLILTVVLGVANSIDQPSRLSLMREIVAPEHLGAAVTLNALSFHVARFVAPMIAGALIIYVHIGVTILVTAATLGFFALCLLKVPLQPRDPDNPRPKMLQATGDGYRYLMSNKPARRVLIVMTTLGVGVGGVSQMLPAIADRLFSRGVEGFVELTAAAGLGSVGAAIVLLASSQHLRGTASMSAGLIGAAAALALLALAPIYGFGVAALFAASFCMTFANVSVQTVLNMETRHDMLGRVMGVYSALVRGAPAIGGLLMGILAPLTGFTPIILVCAIWTALYGLLLAAMSSR